MRTLEVDVAVIGAGTAGMNAYRAALAHTDRVVLIESALYGTTCARVGCMPSKLLIAAAEAAANVRLAPTFGVHGGDPAIDGPAVMRRLRHERDRFVGFVVDAVEAWPEAHRLRGTACFADRHTIRVDDQIEVRAGRTVIASGSRPRKPAEWSAAIGERLLVNDDVFEWQDLPSSLAVIGAGVIGIELAQALHALGVRVRLLGRSKRLLHLTDPQVAECARQLTHQHLPYVDDAQHLQFQQVADGVRVGWMQGGAQVHEEFEYVLCAIGRESNLDALNLQAIDPPRDAQGRLLVDRDTCQLGDTPIFVAGDVHALTPILHEAADDGRIAGENAGRWPDLRAHPRRVRLNIAFSDPQAVIVGDGYAELQAKGQAFACGAVNWSDQGRARVMARNAGLLRVYGDCASGLFLGAEMLGPNAEHIGHLLAWSLQQGLTVERMLDMPFYHPVLEEGLRTALRELLRELRMGPAPARRGLDCGPGA
ncbi:dihydrolipoyl dehydrogenase [Pseudomarimonas arenosa]|uniref:Dihydrolipoyl dehydrogenase n=1 Tax=Pseudomarimonas arenosa TaxID=2774145 RepID=A0AAW3ZR77_9GAMM|nr:dihydrolipoyl dehydrogenase [Pseudomarimonas arenosa]MBD8527114.1 dihydrolipoyl dehydrogenase [Pseudomarimonas arenosa]